MLIAIESHKYLRRLVRELNNQVNGFYVPAFGFSARCNRARFKHGVLEVKGLATSPRWFIPSKMYFTGVNGNEIVASRKP